MHRNDAFYLCIYMQTKTVQLQLVCIMMNPPPMRDSTIQLASYTCTQIKPAHLSQYDKAFKVTRQANVLLVL